MRNVILAAIVMLAAVPATATLIDFETDGMGNPLTLGVNDFVLLPSNEYFEMYGVNIEGSDPASGFHLNFTNPLNSGTSINGNYVNVGGFAGIDTSIDVDFPGPSFVSFDWATGELEGLGSIRVTVEFDDINLAKLDFFVDSDPNLIFLSQAGQMISPGSFYYETGGAVIKSIEIEDQGGDKTLILDNLEFGDPNVPLPEPGTIFLLAVGGVPLLLRARRRKT